MKTFAAIILIAASLQASAQMRFDNLESLLEHVKANNPDLKAEHLYEEISEARLRSSWSALLPQIKAFGTFDNNVSLPVQLVPAQFLGGAEGEFAEVRFGTRYNATYGAEASLSLVNVSSWKNISSGMAAEKASHWQHENRKLSLIEQATTSYYFALLSREAATISQNLVNAADSLLAAAQSRLANGLIEPMEYNRVKAIQLESLAQLNAHQGTFTKNIYALKALAGMNASDSILLSESISLSTQESLEPSQLQVSVKTLPGFQMFTWRERQAVEDMKRYRAKVLPELSLFARYAKQTFSNEYNVLSNDQPWYEVGVIGLRAEWSLFSGFNRQSGIRQAALQSQVARQQLLNFTLQEESEMQALTINHTIAAQKLLQYKEHFQLNSENYRIAGVKYTEGVYSIDQYVNIYREFISSQNEYLKSLADFLVYESIIRTRNTLK